MRTTNIRVLSALLIAALISHSPDAFAEKGGKGHGYGHDKHDKYDKHDWDDKGHRGKHDKDHRVIIIDNSDRVIIKRYIADNYYHNCPPGLAKKYNGCLPPGQAKKHYVIGQPLLVGWEPVPYSLRTRLHPVPAGYQYVMVDRDVLLISEASKHVIDAITLYSAVGN